MRQQQAMLGALGMVAGSGTGHEALRGGGPVPTPQPAQPSLPPQAVATPSAATGASNTAKPASDTVAPVQQVSAVAPPVSPTVVTRSAPSEAKQQPLQAAVDVSADIVADQHEQLSDNLPPTGSPPNVAHVKLARSDSERQLRAVVDTTAADMQKAVEDLPPESRERHRQQLLAEATNDVERQQLELALDCAVQDMEALELKAKVGGGSLMVCGKSAIPTLSYATVDREERASSTACEGSTGAQAGAHRVEEGPRSNGRGRGKAEASSTGIGLGPRCAAGGFL